MIKRFIGSDDGLELKIVKRGAKPQGGGQVRFTCPTKMKLLPINLTDPGKIKRIRGIAYAMRVAPAVCNRLVDAAKGILLKFLPDVYIVTDHQKRENAGNSPAFGLTLVAETIGGTFLCGEACSLSQAAIGGKRGAEASVPEEIAMLAARNLLEEINRGGCVDSSCQHLSFLYMALNQRDISRILSGVLSPYSIGFLRCLRDNFEVRFKIEPCRQNREVDINHKRLKEEKEAAELEKKNARKRKRNLQLPQEIADDKEEEIESDGEVERKKKRVEAERTEESVQEYLKLGHEKLLMSCLGIGFTNLTKSLV
jgi:RNA 3'-terminal phosphate cyclase-like protein